MNKNTHYRDALNNRPPLVRGPDEQIRKHMDNQVDTTLALVQEQHLANLISLLAISEFSGSRENIIDEIAEITGFDAMRAF